MKELITEMCQHELSQAQLVRKGFLEKAHLSFTEGGRGLWRGPATCGRSCMGKLPGGRTALGPGMETRDPTGSAEILEGFV